MKQFFEREDGLVTIEWVALGAVVFLAAIGISIYLLSSTERLAGAIAGEMSETATQVSGGDDNGGN